MTKQEKLDILEAATAGAYEALSRFGKDDFNAGELKLLLDVISDLEWLTEKKDNHATLEDAEPEEPKKNLPKVHTERVDNLMVSTVIEEPKKPEPTPEPEGPQYKMEDVRAALAKARGKGVNVTDIIRCFGVDNFAVLDKAKYPAVMQKLEEELKKKEGN